MKEAHVYEKTVYGNIPSATQGVAEGGMLMFTAKERTLLTSPYFRLIRQTDDFFEIQSRCRPEEWVVVENSHEAIVTHEEYAAANAKLRKVKYNGVKRKDTSDRDYYCAYCGRRLRKTFGSDEYYSCATKLYRTDSPCCDVRWSRTEIEEVVLAAYKAQLSLMSEEYKRVIQTKPQTNPLEDCRRVQKEVQKELDAFASWHDSWRIW